MEVTPVCLYQPDEEIGSRESTPAIRGWRALLNALCPEPHWGWTAG